jgi:hypothetical protein
MENVLTPEEMSHLKEKYSSSLSLIELSKKPNKPSRKKDEMEQYQKDLHDFYRTNEIISDSLMNRSFTI